MMRCSQWWQVTGKALLEPHGRILVLVQETRPSLATRCHALPSSSSCNACCPWLLPSREMHNIYFLNTVAPNSVMAILRCANIHKMLCVTQLCLEALPTTAAGCVQPQVTGGKRTSAMSFLNKSFIICLMLHSLP